MAFLFTFAYKKVMAKAKKTKGETSEQNNVISEKVETKKSNLISVFDKKSNRKRELTQEQIELDTTRYRLR